MAALPVGSIFVKVREGDAGARDALCENSFTRLRLIAASLLSRERWGHTLQPTTFVADLFFKLRGFEHRILDENHFFGIAARAMRQVLIDHARVRKSKVAPEAVHELLSSRYDTDPELRITVKAVFQALKRLNPPATQTVWLRSVEGVTLGEISRRQGREVWRVQE